MVESDAPSHLATELALKLPPLRVSVVSELPALALVGFIDESVGAGLFIVKVFPPDVPPPGAGLNTVTVAVPAVARFAAGMTAVRVEDDT